MGELVSEYMNTTWTKSEISVLRKYATCSLDELLSLIPSKTRASIATKRRRLSLQTRHSFDWTTERRILLKQLWPQASWKRLEKEFPTVKRHALGEMARRLGANREVEGQRKGTLQPLLEDSPEAWYWIGFIAADGWISKDGQVVVTISEKDKNHLKKFAKFLQTEVGDGGTSKGKWGKFKMVRVAVQDHVLGQKIKEKYGFKPQKTSNPPNLSWINSEDKFLAFWAGFIDGDGSFVARKEGGCDLKIECHLAWFDLIREFEHQIFKILQVHKERVYTRVSPKGYSYLAFGKAEVLRLFRARLVALKVPLLGRKWNRVKNANEKNHSVK